MIFVLAAALAGDTTPLSNLPLLGPLFAGAGRSLRGSAMLRWEWRPGSTLFLAWQHQRSGQLWLSP